MKQRHGFISNSSSSSFVIAKSFITQEQIDYIKKEVESCEYEFYIHETQHYLRCYGHEDNGSFFSETFAKCEVSNEYVAWEEF